jgi:hypothetical protein
MTISRGNLITWSDLTDRLLVTLKSVCCNIDSYKSDVPSRLRVGTPASTAVRYITTTNVTGSGSVQTFTFYANNGGSNNLIPIADTNVIRTEWENFLSAAHIDTRSNKVINFKDFGLVTGLISQFMAFHLKPINSKRQIFNTIETQSEYNGTKYLDDTAIGATCIPKYDSSPVDPTDIPVVTDDDIQNIVNQNIYRPGVDLGILNRGGDPRFHKVSLE